MLGTRVAPFGRSASQHPVPALKRSRQGSKQLKNYAVALAAQAAVTAIPAQAEKISLRATGLVSTHKFHTAIEKAFYASLAEKTGLDVTVNFNPLDVVGVNMKDTLRNVRSGAFDIVETTIGSAARDDAFLEGIDLIGVATTIEDFRKAVDAYRPAFEKRVAEKFNAKVLTLWPYGPQVFYCKPEIKTLADFKGLKVRSYTPSMSKLVQSLGATPVTLQFAEVYPALQRGVADCAITSPTSGNTGKWPEVTTHFVNMGISWSANGHFMNLDKWNSLSPEAQAKLTEAFKTFEGQFWDLAKKNNGWAIACNTGGEGCENYTKYGMTLVTPTAEDKAKVTSAVEAEILPSWKATCTKSYPACAETWNASIGKALGVAIK